MPPITDKEYLSNLKQSREQLKERLIDLALEMAQQGKKIGEVREQLRIIEIKIKKVEANV